MNIDLLLKIADTIEDNPDHFDLSSFVTRDGGMRSDSKIDTGAVPCGTTMCIAGWANFLGSNKSALSYAELADERGAADRLDIDAGYDEMVKDYFGITEVGSQAHRLFYAGYNSVWYEVAEDYGWERDEYEVEYGHIHGKHAADVLRRIASGEVVL